MPTAPRDKLMDHEYDGIREYDNPTPGWWHAIFISSVIFALFYALFWHGSPLAWSVQEAWEADQVAEYKRIFGTIGNLSPDEATFQRMRSDTRMQAVARSIFEANCAACHAKDGGGINGVNLTDNFYKNVKAIPDIFNTITHGANAGAMPAWENRLGQNERIIMAAFVLNLRGTTPGMAKKAEGVEIPPFPPAPAESAPPTAPAPAPAGKAN